MHDVRRLPVGEDNQIALTLDDLAREGARRMIAAALEAEVAEYVESFADEIDEDGKRLVVRNGRARERRVTVGSGTVAIRAPRVNDQRIDEETGERRRFSSKILPAYARRSPKVNDVLPVLYLRGLSTGDFRPALEQLLGEDAAGLSPSTITRLCKDWEAEHARFKLAALVDALETSPAAKIAVFATFAATVRYLDEHLPTLIGGRERVVVIGNESTPDQRTGALGRFAPDTVVRPGYEPADGEIDLLISTDVLSEGQNLQQAQAVVSYDMPWNPQRVVQRNGRIIRLLSPHDEVLLTTMLPDPGELEGLLGLEARIQAKIVAAGVYGMESEVIEGTIAGDLRAYADRLASGDEELLDEGETESGAFVGEQLRRLIDRAVREGEAQRVMRLPWGVGACFRQTAASRSTGPPGVFLAIRTPPTPGEENGRRYWRYVELASGELESNDLEILRRIDPTEADPVPDGLGEVDLEAAWQRAAADVIEHHNRRTDVREEQEAIGPRQRWALDILRDPGVAYAPGAEEAEEALSVGRSSAVRKALGAIETSVHAGDLTIDQAAAAIVAVVEQFGLQPVEEPALPQRVTTDELGVVCWIAVLPPERARQERRTPQTTRGLTRYVRGWAEPPRGSHREPHLVAARRSRGDPEAAAHPRRSA